MRLRRHRGNFGSHPWGWLLAGLLLSLGWGPAVAGDSDKGGQMAALNKDKSGKTTFDKQAALKASRAVVGNTLPMGEYTLRDRQGELVSLSRFRGKPLVISIIYTSCYHICPMTTKNVAKAVEQARENLGKDTFNVITVGFDTENDTPTAMRAFAQKQGVASEPNWWFLSGDSPTIKGLTNNLGFRYKPSPNGFDHVVQTTVADSQGKIYRQIYGKAFSPPRLVRPLKELVLGSNKGNFSLSGIANNVRFFCTTYDPSSGSYRLDYGFFLRVFLGLVALAGVAVFLIREIRKSRKASNL